MIIREGKIVNDVSEDDEETENLMSDEKGKEEVKDTSRLFIVPRRSIVTRRALSTHTREHDLENQRKIFFIHVALYKLYRVVL